MKNKLLAALLLMIAASFAQVCAQVDTIRGKVPFWHYNYYDSMWCQSQVNQGELYFIFPGSAVINEYGVRNVPENHSDRYGRGFAMCKYLDQSPEVAIQMNLDSAGSISGLVFGYNTNIEAFGWFINDGGIAQYIYTIAEVPHYYTDDYIFNIYDDGMNLIWSDTVATGELKIDYYMEAGFNYTLHNRQFAFRDYYTSGFGGYEAPFYIGLCKIDFDTVIQVPENFYVGITSSSQINIIEDTMLIITALYEVYYVAGNDSIYCMPYESRRYRIAAQSVGEEILNWADEECHYGVQTCLYPILVLPCGEVTGLRCQAVGGAGTVALVEWDGGANNAAYEVSFGPRGTPPGEGTVTTVTVPRLVHSLDRNTHYDFYVRARCDLADTTWTDWSGPLHVHLATAGIDGAEHVEWSLTPNPAHGSATVRCDEGIRSVALLTVKGERILYQEMAGEQTCTLDLGGLAKGVYIVQVTTAQGTAARKLAVE